MQNLLFALGKLKQKSSWSNNIGTQFHKNKLLVFLYFIASIGFSSASWAIETDYAVFGDGDGVIYAIPADGNLRWFQHRGRMDGSVSWANGGILKNVGTAWAEPTKVFSGGDGVIYTIASDGVLRWYRHNGRFTGTTEWANNHGLQVGSGWGVFQHVFSGGDGVIYGIKPNGSLHWYRHEGRLDGSFKWASNSGAQVGTGWTIFQHLFGSGDGVIYGVGLDGKLYWYRHDGRFDGSFKWASNSGAQVGTGWTNPNFKQAFSGGDGIIYVVRDSGELAWYRHKGWLTGVNSWVSNTGKPIGNGWLIP